MLRGAQHDRLKTCRAPLHASEHVHSAVLPQAPNPLPMPHTVQMAFHTILSTLLKKQIVPSNYSRLLYVGD